MISRCPSFTSKLLAVVGLTFALSSLVGCAETTTTISSRKEPGAWAPGLGALGRDTDYSSRGARAEAASERSSRSESRELSTRIERICLQCR